MKKILFLLLAATMTNIQGIIPANAAAPVRAAIPLEPNEIEILKGLSEKVND